MTNEIVIIGGGGHAKVVIDCITSANKYKIRGIVDNRLTANEKVMGVPVLGGDKSIEERIDLIDKIYLTVGVGAVRATDNRQAVYGRYKKLGFKFPPIIHGSAYISEKASYKDGTQVMARAVIGAEVIIGENVVIYSGCVLEHDCKIASHCYISPGVIMGGSAEVGENTFVGLGARILQGVKIGRRVTVGAGAVVVNNVEDGKTVAGIPAKEIMHE